MTDRLTPQHEAEIAARATNEHLTTGPWRLEYEQCDCSDGYCHHGAYVAAVVSPMPTPIAAERIARTGEEPRDYDFSRTEMGDFTDADWELMVHAREDIPALLAELAVVRAERDEARRDAELQRADYFSEAARLLEDAGRDDDAVNLLDIVADGIRTHAPAEGGAR